jgi:glycosyltransferase involved in cell wall biosynthesis
MSAALSKIMYRAWLIKMAMIEHRRWGRKAVDSNNGIRVYYGQDHVPLSDELASGGIIKCQDLQKIFPNNPVNPNTLYLVSSALPAHLPVIVKVAKSAGAPIVLNQNGVAYPAWHGSGWEETNKYLAIAHSSADYIIYQSKFCQESAWRFLGKITTPFEVLYNPVDTINFSPASMKKEVVDPVMLIAGSHLYSYRVTLALDALKILCKDFPSAKLIIAGIFRWGDSEKSAEAEIRKYVSECNLNNKIVWIGKYSQSQAPDIFRSADILLHTTYNDSCPRLVVEAMACGLPVVYSSSGGVPELVGDKAGIGIPAPSDWNFEHPPTAHDLAEAVRIIIPDYLSFSKKARERAVDMFDLKPWIQRHKEIFTVLAG